MFSFSTNSNIYLFILQLLVKIFVSYMYLYHSVIPWASSVSHCITSLGNYNIRLHYKSRKSNIDADALSRMPQDRVINQETVGSLIANAVTKYNAVVEAHVGSAVTVDNSAPVLSTPSISRQKGAEEQSNDPNIDEIK